MFAMDPLKPGETYQVPVLAIVVAGPARIGYEPKLRAVFPNLAYEAWEGSGHFLMMESPDRFNRALEQFLAQQNKHSNAAIR
jgi:pimeloyl-ACP methyl ester carboxylesterase